MRHSGSTIFTNEVTVKTPSNIANMDSMHNGREEEAFPSVPGPIAEQETFFCILGSVLIGSIGSIL